MLELIKTGACIVGVSIGFTALASAIILGVGMLIGGKDTEDEGPLDPPAA